MAGASKKRANKEREDHTRPGPESSSGTVSSSSKPSGSAQSDSNNGPDVSPSSHRDGYDGNRDPNIPAGVPIPTTAAIPKNLDLGIADWAVLRGVVPSKDKPMRPPLSKLGIAKKIGLNSFYVDLKPDAKWHVYQLDVLIGSGVEKRAIIQKVWNSKALQNELGDQYIIFDGNRLAWTCKKIPRDIKMIVDLDVEQDRKPRPGKEDRYRIVIKETTEIRFDRLMAYLANQASIDNACLEALTFYDHLFRQTPQSKYTNVKRSYFMRGQERMDLGGGVEAFKGVYQSLRIVNAGNSAARLAVNLDVSNGIFWTCAELHYAAMRVAGSRDVNDLAAVLRMKGEKSGVGQAMKKLRRIHVTAKHRGKEGTDEYVIDRFMFGKGAKDHKFTVTDPSGKEVNISIYDYFLRKYNIRLQHPTLPLVKATRGKETYIPMEILRIKENQRYPYKLSERQTAAMIKVAVTPPPKRWDDIDHGLKMLSWKEDPFLQNYGVEVNPSKTVVESRLLPAPKVKFGHGEARPGTSGRWDLMNKKFLQINSKPLRVWGVCLLPSRRGVGSQADIRVVQDFLTEFVKVYQSHGGIVENKQPSITVAQGDDVGSHVTHTWNNAGQQSHDRPQILVFILPDKDSTTYGRIKRSGDCRYGVVTQCLQWGHISNRANEKSRAQYMSNVCMKFNAKLGGITARAIGPTSAGECGVFKEPTLIIGADVSHPAPGVMAPSMAALTVSMDKLNLRYAAACETNGVRVEMITTDNINKLLEPMLKLWMMNIGGGKVPKRIIYLRDGVSEGQYQQVLEQEVYDIKLLLTSIDPGNPVPITAIVGSKRHHVRFFPQPGAGDRAGNPLPGTLVETGVTHPYDNDFYLCGHAAIKGTARPVHYYVIQNECKMSNNEIQTMLYEHVYQFMRSTTPVSIHPAIYYAHLASNRAAPHYRGWMGSSSGATTKKSQPPPPGSHLGSRPPNSDLDSSNVPLEVDTLMQMPNPGRIRETMWYI